MQKYYGFLLLSVAFVVSNTVYSGTIDPPYEVGTWQVHEPVAKHYNFG